MSTTTVTAADSRDYFACLSRLTERAFGGKDVANSGRGQADESFYVEGALASGALSAIAWFREKIEIAHPKNKRFMLFLVGGPGNGKSYVARKIGEGLKELSTPLINKHARKYEYQCGTGQKLVAINDATIPERDTNGLRIEFPLINNIVSAVSANDLLMVNVNRGILNQELQCRNSSPVGRLIVEWLSSTGAMNIVDSDFDDWTLAEVETDGKKLKESIRSAIVSSSNDDLEISVLAVHLDRYSMFEAQPKIKNFDDDSSGFPRIESTYKVRDFKSRNAEFCLSTPAGALLSTFFDSANFKRPSSAPTEFVDPFAANLENFSKESFVVGFQNILRASELVSAKKVTYREMWGAISLAVIGSASQLAGDDFEGWLKDNQPPAEPVRKRLSDLMKLANLRTHQSIFGAPQSGIDILTTSFKSPITDMTSKVDPAIDAVLGEIAKPTQSMGWASPILETFQSHAEGESVLNSLLYLFRETGDVAADSVTSFDIKLDQEITFALNESSEFLSDVEKRRLWAWYGEYLIRLYALAHGIPAFKFEIQVLTEILHSAQIRPSLSLETKNSIKTLFLPYFNGDPTNRPVFLPLYNSRTEPIVDRTETAKLTMQTVAQLDYQPHTLGDSLVIELWCEECIGRIVLDFPLLREALTSVGNFAGYTELAASLTPRIERLRSTMLKSGKPNNGYFVVNGPQVVEVSRG